ncbi:MAG: hypothetical protein GXY36_01650 [Chloroflexi bacterium]|nr:hypothetical protein [Chloroflexota bacterium]
MDPSDLFRIHSDFRWLVVLLALIALLRLVVGVVRRDAFDRFAVISLRAYTIALDIQFLIGVIFIIWSEIDTGSGFTRHRIEHAVVMLIAVIVAHLPERWKASSAPTRYRNTLLAAIGSLLIIFAGVILLPGGSARWEF